VALPADSTATLDAATREGRFFDSLAVRSRSTWLSRLLYDAMVRGGGDAAQGGKALDETELYKPFAGLEIASVTIVRRKPFDDRSRLNRWGNSLHALTHEKALRRSLLFHEGERLDPAVMVKNKQLFESMGYIYRTDVDAAISPLDSATVDITVTVHDNWSIGADARIDLGRSSLNLFDANLAGTGNRLTVTTNFDLKRWRYGGNEAEYSASNILGTFFRGSIGGGRSFEHTYLGGNVVKELLRPTDFALGVEGRIDRNLVGLSCADSSAMVGYAAANAWGILARKRSFGGSLYLSAAWYGTRFDERPGVAAGINPAYHNSSRAMVALGLYREKFYTTSMLYGYGNIEYLSAGYRAELIGGYAVEEFADNYYCGANLMAGKLSSRENYIGGSLALGGYVDEGTRRWNRMVVDLNLRSFTPLFPLWGCRVRHFTQLHYMRGWKRMVGCNEAVNFARPASLVGFSSPYMGHNRAALNLETVFFTPYRPYGFQITVFSYADAGVLGDHANLLRDRFFSSFGVGMRVRNSRLIFPALQIRLGIFLGHGGWLEGRWAELSTQQSVTRYRFVPSSPDVVQFR
jgi:hypothetical protein